MKKILLTNRYTGLPLEIVRGTVPENFQIAMLEEQTKECLAESIGEADYILVGGRLRIDENILCNAFKLKMIQRSGVGLDSIDL